MEWHRKSRPIFQFINNLLFPWSSGLARSPFEETNTPGTPARPGCHFLCCSHYPHSTHRRTRFFVLFFSCYSCWHQDVALCWQPLPRHARFKLEKCQEFNFVVGHFWSVWTFETNSYPSPNPNDVEQKWRLARAYKLIYEKDQRSQKWQRGP